MHPRLNSLPGKLKPSSLDGFLAGKEANVSYLTAYNSRDSYLLYSRKQAYYITDFRYTQEAQRHIKGVEIFQYRDLFKDIAALAKRLKIRRLGFEAKDLNYAEYSRLKEYLSPETKLIDTFNVVEGLRQVKAPEEIASIKEAIRITAMAFDFLKSYLRPGLKELEIAGELERFIRYRGATMSAFSIMVASGPNSSFPHAPVSERKLRNNDSILIDMGVDINGYKSDLTRVFFLGRITPIQRKIYKIIQEAQKKAIEAIKPGAKINKIDLAARSYIARQGYGRRFGHSLGHGIGLEVHEEPSVSAKNESLIKEGMVFTIEPGIYIPGKFGIRLEEMALVTKKGVEILSGAIDKSI